jgi:hypothetical protein
MDQTSAEIIDLAEARRRLRQQPGTPERTAGALPMMWVPVFFLMPLFYPLPAPVAAAHVG